MLHIDRKEVQIIKQQIKIGNFTNNGVKGYDLIVHLEFNNDDKIGYLNLSVGFESTNNISDFANKKYRGIPFSFNINNPIIALEIFDTEKFLDTEIESEVMLKLENISDNKIETVLEVNDELIKIKFQDYLDIIPTD